MSTYLRLAVAAAAIASMGAVTTATATGHEKCLDTGPSQPVIGGPVPIYRPEYVDPDPGACLRLILGD